MKRAALVAGVSFAALLMAGSAQVLAAAEPRNLVGQFPGRHGIRSAGAEIHQGALQGVREGRGQGRTCGRQDAADPVRAAAHHRFDRQAARDAVRRRPAGRQHRDFLRHRRSSDADGRVHGHPERPPPRLQPLRRVDALHAAHHLVGLRAARRAPARLSGVAWLRPADRKLRATALEDHQDGRAGHRHPPRGRAARVRARPPVRAEAEDGGGAARCRPRRSRLSWRPNPQRRRR